MGREARTAARFRLAGPAAWQDDPDGDLEETAKLVAGALLARVGTDRLLWGSDAPFVGHEHAIDYAGTVALFRRWVPDADERWAIGENGYRFYFGDSV